MNDLGRQALLKLLERGERAALRAESRAVTLPFTQASFAGYFRLPTYRDKQAVHATLREAERGGAIDIEWDRSAGVGGQIKRLTLRDVQALAEHLGVISHAEWVAEASRALERWSAQPRVAEILGAWREMRTVRGQSVEKYGDLVDAIKVIEACASEREVSVRRLSSTLFGSSKRLESLTPWLDILTDRELNAPRRPPEEVFANLGLIKHPPAVYLAGAARIHLGDRVIPVPAPFIALAPRSIQSVEPEASVHTIFSVENLTIFHEIADGGCGRLDGYLVLYTAGMPAPSFIRFYHQLLEQSGNRAIYHAGDIDPAGFRIAACLARVAEQTGHRLRLWQMRADEAPADRKWKTLSEAERTEIQRICERHGWLEERAAMQHVDLAFEQEALVGSLPPPVHHEKGLSTGHHQE